MSACTHDEYHDLPSDKVPFVNNNDIVYFQDNISNKIDTLILSRKDSKWFKTESGINYHYMSIVIEYNKLLNKSIYFKYGISTASVDGVAFYLYCYNVLYGFSPNTISYSILSKTYPYVYVADNNSPDTIPNKVYFTCQNGVIRYEYKEGRVYNLVSK